MVLAPIANTVARGSAAAAVALIGLLVFREIASALPSAQALRWRRLLSFATLPLIVLFSISVVGKLASMPLGTSVVPPTVRSRPPAQPIRAMDSGSTAVVPATAPLAIDLQPRNGASTGVRAAAQPLVPVVQLGTRTSVTISAPARSLVRIILSFPGRAPISYYDLTDSHGYLRLGLRVPQQLALRNGQGDAQIVAQTASMWGRLVVHVVAQRG